MEAVGGAVLAVVDPVVLGAVVGVATVALPLGAGAGVGVPPAQLPACKAQSDAVTKIVGEGRRERTVPGG